MSQSLVINGKTKDLGEFIVSRLIPVREKRFIGPFVFIDHMGPAVLNETHYLNVRPHPHIGLATVTYLYDGVAFHRDSIGSEQKILPGEVNLMIAGKGIVHSERTPEADKKALLGTPMHGLQIWMALPLSEENCEPQFYHYGQSLIPKMKVSNGVEADLIMGSWTHSDGSRFTSPVKTLSQTLYMCLRGSKGSTTTIAFKEKEIGILVVSGAATIDGETLEPNQLVVVSNPENVEILCSKDSVLAVFGGQPFPEPRYIWWNFVSSSKEAIKEAAQKWKEQRFEKVPGETEFIPLPDFPMP